VHLSNRRGTKNAKESRLTPRKTLGDFGNILAVQKNNTQEGDHLSFFPGKNFFLERNGGLPSKKRFTSSQEI
jgi:hypothetical protein